MRATCPYWPILILYFCWRKVILGDFIAGYPDSMCYPTLEGWLRGLSDIFIPINTLVVGTHSYIYKTWCIILAVAFILGLIGTARSGNDSRKVMLFLAVWFLLALAPVYKVFPTLMSCATGGRLAYLLTAPVCALLTYGIAVFSTGNRFAFLFRLIAMAYIGLAAIVLYANNLVWAEAGQWTNKVVQELRAYYKGIQGDPLVCVTGLPTTYKECIYALGVLGQVTKRPMMDRDLSNCARLDFNEQNISLGFLKEAIASHQREIHLLYWDTISESLRPVIVPPQESKFTRSWQGNGLKQIIRVLSVPSMPKPEVHWLQDGTLELVSHASHATFTAIELDLKELPCWYADFSF